MLRRPELFADLWIDLEEVGRDNPDPWRISREELLLLLGEEQEIGFEEGKTMRDYHAAYEPTLSPIEERFTDDQIGRLVDFFGTSDFRMFDIVAVQEGGAQRFDIALPKQILLLSRDGGQTWVAAGGQG